MGDPRKFRSYWSRPAHPWQRARIDEEKVLVTEFGLKNRTEIWKIKSKLKNFSDQAKSLIARSGPQIDAERKQLLARLSRLGLITVDSKLDTVLGLSFRDIASRRLQNLVVKRGIARTLKQARQMITHRHITLGGRMMTSPGYLVSLAEEAQIAYAPTSSFNKEDHPERTVVKTAKPKRAPRQEDSRGFRRGNFRRRGGDRR